MHGRASDLKGQTMATVRYLLDWSHQQSGEIRPGETLRIEYDIQRLPHCRAERYGQKAWSIIAQLRFHPGRQEGAGDVSSGECDVSVPANTTQIELWFKNTDHTGCSTWDSRYGQNYWLNVAAPSSA
jgi:hypothetical protein